MRPAAELRREGMADACVLLVAAKVLPKMGIEEWGQLLGLEQVELREAIRRWRIAQYEAAGVALPPELGGKPPAPPREKKRRLRVVGPPLERTIPCSEPGCALLFTEVRYVKTHVRTAHTKVACPGCGRECTAGGLPSHRKACRAAVAALDAAESRPVASGTGAAGHA